jgi:hypothetical protein
VLVYPQKNDLDTSQIGANSSFWLPVTANFNSIGQNGDPNVEGMVFLAKFTSTITTMTTTLLL